MAIPLKDLGNLVTATVRQLTQSSADLLTENNLSARIEEIDFQVNLIAPNGEEALQISSITATPTRISTSETPETVEVSTQQVGPQSNTTRDESSKEAISDRAANSEQTQYYGRETISTTTHKD